MSVKSKAKKVGWFLLKYLGPQALYFVIDHVAQNAAGRVIKDVVRAATGENASPKKLTTSLQAELDKLVHGKVLPSLQQQQDALRLELERRISPPVTGLPLPPRKKK